MTPVAQSQRYRVGMLSKAQELTWTKQLTSAAWRLVTNCLSIISYWSCQCRRELRSFSWSRVTSLWLCSSERRRCTSAYIRNVSIQICEPPEVCVINWFQHGCSRANDMSMDHDSLVPYCSHGSGDAHTARRSSLCASEYRKVWMRASKSEYSSCIFRCEENDFSTSPFQSDSETPMVRFHLKP
jgi:hypothetical protein